MSLAYDSSSCDVCLFGRSQTEDSRSCRKAAHEQKRGRSRSRGEPLFGQTLREGCLPRELPYAGEFDSLYQQLLLWKKRNIYCYGDRESVEPPKCYTDVRGAYPLSSLSISARTVSGSTGSYRSSSAILAWSNR
jgi:hypothetical protein